MTVSKCYIADPRIDGFLAAKFGWNKKQESKGFNPHKVASYRGLYDQWAEKNGMEPLLPDLDNPTQEDLNNAFKKLADFRVGIRAKMKAAASNKSKRIDRCYDALRRAFSFEQRRDRINYLSNLFSLEVDRLVGENEKVDRQSIVNGFNTDKGFVGGQVSILEGVYNHVHELRQNVYMHLQNYQAGFEDSKAKGLLDYVGAPTTAEEYRAEMEKRYKEFTKIIENWNELIPFVLKDLVAKEGVKLGIKKEYAAAASSDDFGENDIAALWEISESVRDGWQRNNDLESAFGSVGKAVRRILSRIPQIELVPDFAVITNADGTTRTVYRGVKSVPVRDDLGMQKYLDPTKTHQALSEALRGVQNSEDLMKKLCKTKEGQLLRDKDTQKLQAKIPWMQPVVELLDENNQALTEFFVDFKKNFQRYSIMWEDEETSFGFIRSIKTKVLNLEKNLLKGKYDMCISPNGKFPENVRVWGLKYEPIFEEGGGKINWKRLAELRETVLAWTKEDKVEDPESKNIFENGSTKMYLRPSALTSRGSGQTLIVLNGRSQVVTYDMKRDFLMEVFTSLGYDVDIDTIDSILHSKDIYEIRRQLENLFDPKGESGLLYVAGVKSLNASNIKKLSEDATKTFRFLYNVSKDKNDRKNRPVKSHSEDLLKIISNHQEGYRIESRVRYGDNTMYSFVNPSYLGDRLELIQSYVETDNKAGLLEFLKDEYLNSPFFVDDEYLATNGKSGKVLNVWLADIVDACKDTRTPLIESVAAIFNYERDLGREDKKFEDFTSKEHAVDMLIHFFADEQQQKGYGGKGTRDLNKKLSAMFPVFVLGDAGVSKYIRAPRYATAIPLDEKGNRLLDIEADKLKKVGYVFDTAAEDQVLEGFYNIYVQERRKLNADGEMLKLFANGSQVSHPAGEYSILTFLNPSSPDYSSKYAIPEDKKDDKDFVKEVFRQYLDDAAINGIKCDDGRTVPSFMARLESLGVLETADTAKGKLFKQLNNIATPQNIKSKLREYYWNTKLATAQQLQLMTIDPSFYKGSKDLQKRYKEIHAPGTVLDIKAIDYKGNLYSEDGIERVVYFNDLNLNAELTDRPFMEVILRTFAEKGKEEEVEKAIKEDIVVPTNDKKLETIRQDRLKDLLGKNYRIYSAYTENTLTDGQGYRTLKSYRRVKGMAGQWTEDMENAYDEIMAIRESHAVRDPQTGMIIDYTEATPEELKKIGELALVLQPIKPYLFTHEKYPVKINMKDKGKDVIGNDGKPVQIDTYQYIPVQHKYAEALIIPELLPKGNKLRDMGLWMDNNNVDMVGSTKIGKVGVFGQADFEYDMDSRGNYLDQNGNIISEGKKNANFDTLAVPVTKDKAGLEKSLSRAYVHELPYRDYRIQTNVPEHINASQLFGTQVRKLIMAGMKMDSDYSSYLAGFIDPNTGESISHINLSTSDNPDDNNAHASLRGRNILALYNSLICANIFDSYDTFSGNAGDIEKLSELLQQSTVGSMREAMDNILSYVVTGNEEGLKKFLIPLFEGGLEHDAAALILSTFKKIVNKQQISGGSAVQVSAFGIDGYKEDGGLRFVTDPDNNKNILYAEIEMPFDRSFFIDVKNADGSVSKQKVDLAFDKYCNPDGTLIPTGEAIEKGTRDWKKYQSYTYKEVNGKLVACEYDDPQAKVYKPLIEAEYPDILSILAYRIPSERDYSMLNCRIKRFTSKVAGGTLKVPLQGTTIAGFDFDIDKLYFMQREYHKHYSPSYYDENNFSSADTEDIWKKIYEANPDIYNALVKAREEDEAKHPEYVYYEKVYKWGKVYEKPVGHKYHVNHYWKEAGIEEKFNKKKNDLFAETAQTLGFVPTREISKDSPTEYFETYDFNYPPEDTQHNSRAARNNLLITLIQERLMDPQTMRQRYTPGGFENAKNAALRMRVLQFTDLSKITTDGKVDNAKVDEEIRKINDKKDPTQDPEPNYDPTDPYTILVYNEQNQLASKLIGIFANQNANHAFVSSVEKFALKKPISFCGRSCSDFLHKDNPDEAERIDLNVAEFLAASVDAVKDPVLNFLNLNTITADAGAMLARLGFNTNEIGLLFNQPVIRKICVDALNRGVRATTAIKDAKADLEKSLTGVNLSDTFELTESILADSIVREREMLAEGKTRKDFLNEEAVTQYQVLKLFEQIMEASNDISEFVTGTKFTASNAVSSTLGGLYAQQMKVDAYLDKFPKGKSDSSSLSYVIKVVPDAEAGLFSTPISNDPRLITMSKKEYLHQVRFNPFAYEQAMYDANRKALKLLSKYFPYERDMYKQIRKRMQDISREGVLSDEIIDAIHRHIPVALLAKQTSSLFNGEGVHVINGVETNLTNREYYREKFAEDLQRILSENPKLMSLDIFKYLIPSKVEITKMDEQTGRPLKDEKGREIIDEIWTISMQDVGGMDSDIKERIRESWASLMEVDDNGYFKSEEFATLGRDLFMYCFYQLGFDFSPASFMHLAPTAVKDSIIVERDYNLALNYHKGDIKPGTDDVYVWSKSVFGSEEKAEKFGAYYDVTGRLEGDSFQLPDKLQIKDVIALVNEAISHPELKFKIDRDLTQEEFDLFSKTETGVPSNIYFSQSTEALENKEALNYGRRRTYRQFLNEILAGTESGLNPDEFAKMFILNSPNNSTFILDKDRSSKRTREIIDEITKRPGNTLRDGDKFREYIDIDLSAYNTKKDRPFLNPIATFTIANGRIAEAKWVPCIKINGSYYMADSTEDEGFNINRGMKMRYRKVVPLGGSKTVEFDGGRKLTPQIKYKSSMDAEPQRNLDYIPDPEPQGSTGTPGITTSSDPVVNNVMEEIRNSLKEKNPAQLERVLAEVDAITSKESPMISITISELFKSNDSTRGFGRVSETLLDKLKQAIYNRNNNSSMPASPAPSNDSGSSDNSMTPENPTGTDPQGDLIDLGRKFLEDSIIKTYIKALTYKFGAMSEKQIEDLKANVRSQSTRDLADTVRDLRKACVENGVVMLNDQGDPVMGC